MRRFTKSLGSFSWALSLFGFRQIASLFMLTGKRRMPRGAGQAQGAVSAFESVTRTLEEQLGQTLRTIYMAGDRMLHRVVDLTFARRSPRSWKERGGGGPNIGGPGMGGPGMGGPDMGPDIDPSGFGMPPGMGHPSPGDPAPATRTPVSGWGPMPPIPEQPASGDRPHGDPGPTAKPGTQR